MDVVKIAVAIQDIIAELGEHRKAIDEAANAKAIAIAEYDRDVAISLVRLKLGEGVEIDGKLVKDPPVGMIDKLAKGACWEACLKKEVAEAKYKSTVTKMEVLMAQLNGFQSVFRHLDVGPHE